MLGETSTSGLRLSAEGGIQQLKVQMCGMPVLGANGDIWSHSCMCVVVSDTWSHGGAWAAVEDSVPWIHGCVCGGTSAWWKWCSGLYFMGVTSAQAWACMASLELERESSGYNFWMWGETPLDPDSSSSWCLYPQRPQESWADRAAEVPESSSPPVRVTDS